MSFLLRQLSRIPVLTETQLAWQRSLLDRAYAKDIAAARRAKESAKVAELESSHMFELQMHDEDEDSFITRRLLSKARRLRVPIPRRYNQDGSHSDLWYEGSNTGRSCLTTEGMSTLREQLRKEVKARHELRSQWTVWLAALTGLIGAITGLVAMLK
jgi:hypothetical protein